MIVSVKNKELFQQWLHYLQSKSGESTYYERAMAFIRSNNNEKVPSR